MRRAALAVLVLVGVTAAGCQKKTPPKIEVATVDAGVANARVDATKAKAIRAIDSTRKQAAADQSSGAKR